MKWLVVCVCVLSLGKSTLQDRESESFEGTSYSGSSHGQGGKDFYEVEIADHLGKKTTMDEYRGKVLLVVNVASECGFTERSYTGLVKLQKLLGNNGKFQILAFPCNQFGGQEPKSAPEVLKFATETYKVNFPIMEKVNVVDPNAHELFKYLVENSGVTPTWNFYKYLVSSTGSVLKGWGPWTDIEEIFPDIKKTVAEAVRGADADEASGPRRPASSKAKPPAPSQNRNGIVGPPPPGGEENSDRDSSEGGIPGNGHRRGEPPTPKLPRSLPQEPQPKKSGKPQPPSKRAREDL